MGLSAQDLPAEPDSLSNGVLSALLESAEAEERLMSSHRRALHLRIDNIQVGSTMPEADVALLAALQLEERALSEVRLQLHQWITELRLERGRRLARLRRPLGAVE